MYKILKYVSDVFLALLILGCVWWFLVPCMLILWCTGEHKVWYLQKRVGYQNRIFSIFKFATMLKNSPNMGTGSLTTRNDPRVLPFGRFLRKTKINELPQIFNVLNGTMSIVGPRPVVQRELDLMDEYQRQRFLVKQGITCIWQCSGRANTSFKEQILMDLEYVNKRGFWYDVYLVLKTIPAVLLGKGSV